MGDSPQQPKVDFLTKEARTRAANVSPEDLQREILAQAYIRNHHLTHMAKDIATIKGYVVFFGVLTILSLLITFIWLLDA